MDKRFENLLLKYSQASSPAERKQIEDKLWQKFGAEKAILIMDMSGFSILTQRYGIVHYLSMVRRMQLTSKPIVEEHHGEVVKFEADNCFAMFDQPLDAVQTAFALNTAFKAMNTFTEETFDIRVSIGIDYGKVLLIGGPDYFGAAVNRASKLGEDVAHPGEMLITKSAFDLIPAEAGVQGNFIELAISGLKINAYQITH